MVISTLLLAALAQAAPGAASAQQPSEADYYEVVDIPIPEDVVLEVGGILPRADGSLLACTRRGQIWRLDDWRAEEPEYTLWADGVQEPLGLLEHDGWIYAATRGSLLAMRDEDEDGVADRFRVHCDDWSISGNYHEYNFGPRVDPQGNFWITTNKPFGGQPFGAVDWRGWAMKITPEGKMVAAAGGLRSPAGVEVAPWGDVFYTDNQGEWCGASKLSHIEEGDFHGHPHGIASARLPQARMEHPGDVPDGIMFADAAREIPGLKLPAVWFPYDKTGRSPSGMAWDVSDGAFGPFAGQLFVGEQYAATVLRVSLEKVNGRWQGACYPFRRGLSTGIIRVRQADDGEMLVGGSDRGWAALGSAPWGLQRIRWTGRTPFEIHAMEAAPDGFVLTFTKPVDPASLADAEFAMSSYTYELHAAYGSDEMETRELELGKPTLAEDGLSLHLPVAGLRPVFVHELHVDGMRDQDGQPLLHGEAWYTLIEIPAE